MNSLRSQRWKLHKSDPRCLSGVSVDLPVHEAVYHTVQILNRSAEVDRLVFPNIDYTLGLERQIPRYRPLGVVNDFVVDVDEIITCKFQPFGPHEALALINLEKDGYTFNLVTSRWLRTVGTGRWITPSLFHLVPYLRRARESLYD